MAATEILMSKIEATLVAKFDKKKWVYVGQDAKKVRHTVVVAVNEKIAKKLWHN